MIMDTFLDLMAKEMVKFVFTTRKRRHTFIVCVIHKSYLEINIQGLDFFLHN